MGRWDPACGLGLFFPFLARGAPGRLAYGGRAALSDQLTVTPKMEVTPRNLQDTVRPSDLRAAEFKRSWCRVAPPAKPFESAKTTVMESCILDERRIFTLALLAEMWYNVLVALAEKGVGVPVEAQARAVHGRIAHTYIGEGSYKGHLWDLNPHHCAGRL